MITLVCASDEAKLPSQTADVIPVISCAAIPQGYLGPYVGRHMPEVLARFGDTVSDTAFDLLAIAMAVTAADTFVSRSHNSDDGWCRVLHVVVEVTSPEACRRIQPLLEEALHFLSGDMWSFEFTQGTSWILPSKVEALLHTESDCVSLFSGGLDSAIGVLDAVKKGRKPLLVSHAYQGDSGKQEDIYADLPGNLARIHFNANPRCRPPRSNDVSMRSRSFNFLAMAGAAAASVAKTQGSQSIDLLVPENGFIALNPPLTTRRIGTHSTRTTHPHYLRLVQEIFDGLSIPARIVNPYRHRTKGEMLLECKDPRTLEAIASRTVSCGKWKRHREQCGRCLPCLIRKAAFHKSKAKLKDTTQYTETRLVTALESYRHRDDVLAVCLASTRAKSEIATWAALSGPLPEDRTEYDGWLDVVSRGIDELRQLLKVQKVAP